MISLDSTITLIESADAELAVATPKRVPSPEPMEASGIEEIVSEGVQGVELEDHGVKYLRRLPLLTANEL